LTRQTKHAANITLDLAISVLKGSNCWSLFYAPSHFLRWWIFKTI